MWPSRDLRMMQIHKGNEMISRKARKENNRSIVVKLIFSEWTEAKSKQKGMRTTLVFSPSRGRKFARLSAVCISGALSSFSSITHLLHHSTPPTLSFSNIYLILSHFLCSHLLLCLFSNFIFRLPPPSSYRSSRSAIQTEICSLFEKACQLSYCSRLF